MPMPFSSGAGAPPPNPGGFAQQPPPQQAAGFAQQPPPQQAAAGFAQQPPPQAAPPPQDVQIYVQGSQQPVALSSVAQMPDTTPACELGAQAWSTLGQLRAQHGVAAQATPPPQSAGGYGQQPPQPPQGGGRSPFAGVENAVVTERHPFLSPGRYVCRIRDIRYVTGRNGNYVFAECTVLVSTHNAADPATAQCNQPGSTASICIKQNDSFINNMKALIIACSGFDAQGMPRSTEDVVTQSECDQAVSDEQPFAGALIYVEATQANSREGNQYVRMQYKPCKTLPDGSPDMASIPG